MLQTVCPALDLFGRHPSGLVDAADKRRHVCRIEYGGGYGIGCRTDHIDLVDRWIAER